MKLYTRTGDLGETSVIGGRVLKDDLRVEAYGTIDELNSFLGQSISEMNSERFNDMKQQLIQIQHELFDCGGDLAYARPDKQKAIAHEQLVARLELWIDQYETELEPITYFILPGGTRLASSLHVCRTVCRRAERRVVTLANREPINETVRTYLNRLSDLLFVMSRTANARVGVADVQYISGAEV